MKFYLLTFLLLFTQILSFSLFSQTKSKSQNSQPDEISQVDTFTSDFIPNLLPSPNKAKYEEQISCDASCVKFQFSGTDDVTDKVWEELGKNGGKVVIEIASRKVKIDDPLIEDYVEYLREIAKRDGNVSFEPYYIGYKGFGLTDVPLFNDIFGISYNIYKRLKSIFVFGRMEKYHAKVLYHPTTHDILLIYFLHRNYGSLCDTVYSTCETVQYIDDDLFDLQLSKALDGAKNRNIPIEVRFDQVKAELPQAKLDFDSLLSANRSTRIYKWLILANQTKMRRVQRERFIDLNLIVAILDYTLKAYEFIEAVQLYWPIRSMRAEVIYEETQSGKILQSVVITSGKTP